MIYSTRLGVAPGTTASATPLPPTAYKHRGWPWFPEFTIFQRSALSKLHPRLRQWLHQRPLSSQVSVVVSWRDPIVPLAFPVRAISLGDSLAMAEATSMVDSLRRLRAPRYAAEHALLRSTFGAKIVDSLWVAQSSLVHLRLAEVPALAGRSDVISISPEISGERPPQGCPVPSSASDMQPVKNARDWLGTDLYRDLGYTTGPIRLLDTGVQSGHTAFAGVSASVSASGGPSLASHDCYGSPDCSITPAGDLDPDGHGTTAAGILISPSSWMNGCYGYLTLANLDVYRVYHPEGGYPTALDDWTVQTALQQQVTSGGLVVAVETQSGSGPNDGLAQVADETASKGVVVIGAAGNAGEYSTSAPGSGPNGPGNARRALAVGARGIYGPGHPDDEGQSWGRLGYLVKPELQCPTSTSSAGVHSTLHQLTATSGATPYAAALALIVRRLLEQLQTPSDPGDVYAALLAFGENARGAHGSFPVKRGVGVPTLPSSGQLFAGIVELESYGEVDVPVTLDDPMATSVAAALWWPDPEAQQLSGNIVVDAHYDFDLELVPPGGAKSAFSSGESGVFERAALEGLSGASGGWVVRIRSKGMGTSPKTCYWALVARP